MDRNAFVKHAHRRRNKYDTYYYYYYAYILSYYEIIIIINQRLRLWSAVWYAAANRLSRGITGQRRSNRIKIRTSFHILGSAYIYISGR